MQVFQEYVDYLENELKVFGICIYNHNNEFIGFNNIANEINEVYRLSSDDETDNRLVNLLHNVCDLIE